jgi:hypothetical protein
MLARTPIMLSWMLVSQRFTVAQRYLERVAADAGKVPVAQQASAMTVTNNRFIDRSP